ncbi:MAG: hypothetical protein AB1635_01460 [Acidobacteriota bacterium]
MTLAPLVVALLVAWQDGCREATRDRLAAALEAARHDGPLAAMGLLPEPHTDPGCVPLAVARHSLLGWRTARDAARAGGTPVSLVWAGAAASDLERLAETHPEAAYAHAVVRAAMAAAQDERPEMGVFLDHARAVAARAPRPPAWPAPIDLVEAELWMEVDVYEAACAAYRRVLDAGLVEGGQAARIAGILAGRRCTGTGAR